MPCHVTDIMVHLWYYVMVSLVFYETSLTLQYYFGVSWEAPPQSVSRRVCGNIGRPGRHLTPILP